MRPTFALGGLALAVLVAGSGLALALRDDAPPAVQVRLAAAQRGQVTASVSAAGNTVDGSRRDLAFGSSGELTKVYVKVGTKVKKGQVLARIDSRKAQEAYEAAKADVAAAEEALDQAQDAASTPPPCPAPGRSATGGTPAAPGPATGDQAGTVPAGSEAAPGQAGGKTVAVPAGGAGGAFGPVEGASASPSARPGQHRGPHAGARSTARPAPGPTLTPAPTPTGEPTGGPTDEPTGHHPRPTVTVTVTATVTTTVTATPTSPPNGGTGRPGGHPPATGGPTDGPIGGSPFPTGSSTGEPTTGGKPSTGARPTASGRPTAGRRAVGKPSARPDARGTGGPRPAGSCGRSAGATAGGRGGLSEDQATANVDRAEGALEEAADDVRATRIVAPAAGTVLSVAGGVGDLAGTGTFISLGDLNELQVQAMVTESDVNQLKLGQKAQVTLATRTGERYPGTVTAVAPTATVDDRLVRYAVTLAFDEPPAGLMLGQTASVTITTDEAEDAIYVPAAAVRSRSDGTQVVTVRSGGHDSSRVVRTGVRGDQYVEVTSGLGESDQVVMSGGTSGEFPDGTWPGA
ncbi:efflux RND transporter periplasmic adaptor subunit [Nonomuraea sp. B12E4]|uniref:efflux RND transporter periplasmic adaptor subunit n=1 Tax=Nonomuraea sp. B12E4 TaxID=3153564 RepID=UPI00325C594C